ncbi:Tricalbin [Penicillium hispanicum]|uniref:Tricalbin n=1 Tax=Penicillium hispanicum TaxID=1080232 RepID=UPI0025403F8D|nr:Tricalbin [Penicillium hispanicum]KAJ5580223.1 Tricalbin [Penicillium hispanicum]
MASVDAEKTELKEEGVVEAASDLAQDPQSNVNPETIEQKLVDETRKSGGAAYQFDPNASPEEKAASAAAKLPPGFHHDKKPKGISVITDKDDGKADYDLPPPRSATAIMAEDANAAGGKGPEEEEDMRWALDRTGWAPRFHAEKTEEEDAEATLLDHQTFLEGRIPDKFFGDWYHNAGIIVFACLTSWLIAALGGGVGWVLLVMAACSTYYRTSIRRVRRNYRDDIHREMSKQRLETDTETLEWINSFLVKFWPIYAPVLCDTIINSVDQVLSTSTPAFLDSLRLKTFVLGSKPPRLEHVKTYPKTEPDTVIMDWKFSFTPNDKTDLTARQLKDKINPKVVLEVRVGKGVVSKGLDVIVEDMACSGLMRIKVKLQIPFPHIERVDVCFLDKPDIDYVCKPLGGDHLGFDINFIPGLENFIKEQIHNNLGPMMYDPNVFPVEIAKMLAGNPVDQAIGVVAVTLHGAQQLKNPDKFSGTPDPYAVVMLNHRTELGRTKIVHDTDSPRWNETIYVIITSFSDALSIVPYDWNEYRKDKELGTAAFGLDKLEQEPTHEGLYLEVLSSGRHRGAIHADIRFFPVLEGRKLESGETEPPPELNTGIAQFTVEQAKDLDGSKSLVGKLNPYGVLLLNGKEIHITTKLKRTNNPIFQNASKEFLVTDRKNARLGLIIKDDRDLMTDPIIGRYQIKMNDMIKMMEQGKDWFHLHNAKEGRAKLKLQWKPVALGSIAGGAGYIDPIGVMRFHFKSATDLRNLEAMGKSDPYARVLLSGMTKGRTVTFRNNLNPDWDEVVYVPIRSAREKLSVEVMDEETINKDRTLGWVELNASDFVHETETGEYEIDDEKQLTTSSLRIGKGAPKGHINYTVSFFPSVPVVNPEDEQEKEEEEADSAGSEPPATPRKSMHSKSASVDSKVSKPLSNGAAPNGTTNGEPTTNGRASLETTASRPATSRDSESGSVRSIKTIPRTYVSVDDLPKYESGFIVFKFHEGHLAHSNVQLEVLMDDHMFPAYISPKIHSQTVTTSDIGEAFVRELEFSKITLRLVSKDDPKDSSEDHTVAKLTGDTLPTLQRILYNPTELVLRSSSGDVSKITVSARYIPVQMKLDPRESINNMGSLRVDILDAADLPSADRNGFSDPYCKFRIGDDEHHIFKTKVQKKTLHPAWNEFFETPIKTRIDSGLQVDVYDWDFGDKADWLGSPPIDLEELEPFQPKDVTLPLNGKSGVIRLRLLFKPAYVMRSRQGSSTFSGNFAKPGKVIGAPVKGVGLAGAGVVRGASFLKTGLMSRIHKDKNNSEDAGSVAPSIVEEPPSEAASERGFSPAPALVDGPSSGPSTPVKEHSRNRSTASQAGDRLSVFGLGGTGRGDLGTAHITVVSASGFRPSANVRVIFRVQGLKGAKEVHKTKAHKTGGNSVQYDDTFKVSHITADATYQIRVVDHSTFGSDDVLGEFNMFVVDDQGSSAGQDKEIKVGDGTVVVRSSFAGSEASLRPTTSHSTAGGDPSEGADSPDSRKMPRRSFLSKRSVSGV